MKVINANPDTALRQLLAENEKLKCENRKLQNDGEKYKQLYFNHLFGKRPSTKRKLPPASDEVMQEPASYARPTAASKRRADSQGTTDSLTIPEPELISNPMPEDGRASRLGAKFTANFAEPTKAVLRRGIETLKAHGREHPMWEDELARRSTKQVVEVRFVCPKCSVMIKQFEHDGKECLRKRSRLGDNDFYDTPASQSRVRFTTQLSLMRSAYSLAQGILWSAMRRDWRGAQLHYYPQGPEQVRFGYGELCKVFGDLRFPYEHLGFCGMPPRELVSWIERVVDLRNVVCHLSPLDTKMVDVLMLRAQALAVILQDEPRAFRIRELRDQLRGHAVQAYEEILKYDDYEALRHLNGAQRATTWAMHHQCLFEDIMRNGTDSWQYRECGTDGWHFKWDPAIVCAAKAWASDYTMPGVADPESVARAAKKKAYFEEHLNLDFEDFVEYEPDPPEASEE